MDDPYVDALLTERLIESLPYINLPTATVQRLGVCTADTTSWGDEFVLVLVRCFPDCHLKCRMLLATWFEELVPVNGSTCTKEECSLIWKLPNSRYRMAVSHSESERDLPDLVPAGHLLTENSILDPQEYKSM